MPRGLGERALYQGSRAKDREPETLLAPDTAHVLDEVVFGLEKARVDQERHATVAATNTPLRPAMNATKSLR